MKKLFYPMMLLLLLFSACNEEEIFENSEYKDIPDEGTKLKMAGDGVYDVLGFGYNISGTYLHPESVKDAVIDITRFATEYPSRLYYNATTGGTNMYYYGADAEDYLNEASKEFNTKTTIGAGFGPIKFSSTFETNQKITNKYEYSTKFSFASCDVIKNLKRIYISADLNLLKDYVNPTFIIDLNILTPDEIIERYGIVVLTDITIGGRLNLIYKSAIKSTSSTVEKQSIIKAGINETLKMMNLSFDVTVTNEFIETHSSKNEERSLYIEYFGGTGTGMSVNLETGYPSININTWESSVSLGNCGLTKIDWSKAYPIWEFVTDPTQKNQIKEAAIRYCDNNAMTMLNIVPVYIHQIWLSPLQSRGKLSFTQTASSELLFFIEKPAQSGSVPLYTFKKSDGFGGLTSNTYSYSTGTLPGTAAGVFCNVWNNSTRPAGTVPLYRFSASNNSSIKYYDTDRNPSIEFPMFNVNFEAIECYVYPK